jgi:hypothetical protein
MKKTKCLRGRRRVALAAISTAGALAVAAGAKAAPLNTNLVLNGDFENVNLESTGAYNGPQILGWQGMSAFAYSHDGSSSSGGVVPNYADGAQPPGAGHWYFTSNNAGPTDINARGLFFQDIDVSGGPTAVAIAAGTARYDLSAFMSSYLNDTDIGHASVDFLDESGGTLDIAVLSDPDFGPNNVWNLNTLSGDVPAGTTMLRLSLYGTRTAGGAGPDGYIDNVALSVTVVPEPGGLAIAGGLSGLMLARRRRRDGP